MSLLPSNEVMNVVNLAIGAVFGIGVKTLSDRGAARKASTAQLRRDVNEFMAACSEVQMAAAALRTEHESGRAKYSRILLMFMETINRTKWNVRDGKPELDWFSLAAGGAAGAVSVTHWDRDASKAIREGLIAPMARLALAAAALRGSGDQRFRDTANDTFDAVSALLDAYSHGNKRTRTAAEKRLADSYETPHTRRASRLGSSPLAGPAQGEAPGPN